ncbi:MAG TPA: hypothetical protein VHD87_15190 [Acidimicrobiales bacterium]|nr:hypothetical protein [Acidimicrobiales bacterium]
MGATEVRVFDLELNADDGGHGIVRLTVAEWRAIVEYMRRAGMVSDAGNQPTDDELDAAEHNDEAMLDLLRRPNDNVGLPAHKLIGSGFFFEDWELQPAEIASALAAYEPAAAGAVPVRFPDVVAQLHAAADNGMRVVRRVFVQVQN